MKGFTSSIRSHLRGTGWADVKIHGLVCGLISVLLFATEPRYTLMIGGALCFTTYIYLGFREAVNAPLRLSPLSFLFFWYSIGMGISPLYVGFFAEAGDTVKFASPNSAVALEDLAAGYVLFVIGIFLLHAGMHALRPPVSSTFETDSGQRLIKWLAAIWAAGLLFQVSPASFSFLGATVKILSVALVGSVCALATTPRKRLGLTSGTFVVLLIIGTVGLLFGNLASISKAYIMFSFLPLFWLFIIRPRLRLWIPVFAVTLAILYFVVVAPVVYTSRQKPLEEGESPRAHLIETFDDWMKEKPGALDQSFFADQVDQFLNRQFDSVPVGFIVGEVKSSGTLHGETLKYASYAFIPRLLWPDKPTVTRGAWFSTYLGLFQMESEATTSVGMTAVGELYWNYGTLGVVIGMLGIGLLQGYLWRMAGADPRGKPVHMLLYVSTMLGMSDMPEAVTVFASVAVTILTFKAALVAIELLNRSHNIARRSGRLRTTSDTSPDWEYRNRRSTTIVN